MLGSIDEYVRGHSAVMRLPGALPIALPALRGLTSRRVWDLAGRDNNPRLCGKGQFVTMKGKRRDQWNS